jgi:hypothetical protein
MEGRGKGEGGRKGVKSFLRIRKKNGAGDAERAVLWEYLSVV